jgi:hypothetical protein
MNARAEAAAHGEEVGERLFVGPYVGELAAAYRSPRTLAALAELRGWLEGPSAKVLAAGGRNRHICIDLPLESGESTTVIVKAFGRQSWLNRLRDRRRGSKARRSWLAAAHLNAHGVGTPTPVGYLERWNGSRLEESYFIALYTPHAQHFGQALNELFHERPEASLFMELLECVAGGIRAMHAAGFVHNDLGHQNLLLTPNGNGRWGNFQVIDLNRGRLRPQLSLRERALDFARLDMPSQLLLLLMKMYWRGSPPRALASWEKLYRTSRRLHIASRRWRHPIREARRGRSRGAKKAPQDAWIWDERSGQAIGAHLRGERLRLYPAERYIRTIVDSVRAAPSVWTRYREALGEAFSRPVTFEGRVGVSIDPTPVTLEQELHLLAALGAIPVMVRFYHHEGLEGARFRSEVVRRLHQAAHPVSIALVQDRRAVLNPGSWRSFIGEVLDRVAPLVQTVEIGHNINRAKWGIWSFEELRRLYEPLNELRRRYPGVRFTGPGVIDFEYTFLLPALRQWPSDLPLAQLSHHLYVDRRGAPENPQGRFATVEKAALLRAVARYAGAEEVTITEVNWPLAGTGVHSPVLAPYCVSGNGDRAGVSEELYAHYMIRYLCLVLGSGFVDRVYWWRLAAKGFGLVDDSHPTALRPRPGYHALRHFLSAVGDATLMSAALPLRTQSRHGRYRFEFRRRDGENVVLTYAHGPELSFAPEEKFKRVEDESGQPLARPSSLSGRPIYLRAMEGAAQFRQMASLLLFALTGEMVFGE